MSKRVLDLPMGHMYLVLPNGAAAQLNYMDVNTLQVALDHLQEHLNDLMCHAIREKRRCVRQNWTAWSFSKNWWEA